ncbi:polysaccharide biosynthesis tyrosine autokinase [Nakamurella sp. GG22]
MDLSILLRALRKYWWIVVVTTLVALGAGALVTMQTPNKYESTVTFFVRTPAEQIGGAYQGDQFAQKRVNSYVQLLSSVRLGALVATDTQLSLTPDEIVSRITGKGDPNTVLLTATVTDSDAARSLDIAKSIGTTFVSLVSTLETAPGSDTPSVSLDVTSPPALNPTPVAPKPLIIMAVSLIVGLALGIALALLRELLDKTIRTVESLRDLTKSIVLGTIAFDDSAKSSPLIVDSRARSVRAEAFRQLRTNLQYVDVDDPLKVIAVTSSVAGEGKSSTATNLAVSFAEAGSTVLLIEGDLRRPKVAEYLGLEGSIGLTNVLTGRLALEDVLQPWGKGGLSVLASGPIPPNPAELLGSKSMAQLLKSLKKSFEIIIIDTPPLLPVTDGAIISAEADGAILVVRHGRTTRHQVSTAVASLEAVDARLLGSVMNMMPTRGADAYGYGYGYDDIAGSRPQLTEIEETPPVVSAHSGDAREKVPS